jgi:hypothetical protein
MKRARFTGYIRPDGYIVIQRDGVRTYEHVEVAERVLGKPLPPGAVVHHVDENPSNNDPGNLVVCPDDAYHALIHQRTRALDECGHASWRKCSRCGDYDDPARLVFSLGQMPYHQACNNRHQRTMRQKRAALLTKDFP